VTVVRLARYREVFTIHAICSWCVSSAIVFALLAAVATVRAVRAAYGPGNLAVDGRGG
jgi:uncharacterized membrane protein